MVLITSAKFCGQWFTPYQFEQKKELINKSKKKNCESLRCADGCELIFKKSAKYCRNGTNVYRQAHFAHKCKRQETTCKIIKKYGNGGESEEHFKKKLQIASKEYLVLKRQCSDTDCNKLIEEEISKSWIRKVEHRVGKYIVDVAFYEKDELVMVIEVKHKHAVDGEKRKWFKNQDFIYFEVSSTLYDYKIIDAHDTFFCEETTHYETEDDTFLGFFQCCSLGEARRQRRRKWREERMRERHRLEMEEYEREKKREIEFKKEQERLKKEREESEERQRMEKERMQKQWQINEEKRLAAEFKYREQRERKKMERQKKIQEQFEREEMERQKRIEETKMMVSNDPYELALIEAKKSAILKKHYHRSDRDTNFYLYGTWGS